MSVSNHVRVSRGCTGCGVCVEVCPTDVLRLVDGVAVVAYEKDCQACFLCVIDCSFRAISVKVQLGPSAQILLREVNDGFAVAPNQEGNFVSRWTH